MPRIPGSEFVAQSLGGPGAYGQTIEDFRRLGASWSDVRRFHRWHIALHRDGDPDAARRIAATIEARDLRERLLAQTGH